MRRVVDAENQRKSLDGGSVVAEEVIQGNVRDTLKILTSVLPEESDDTDSDEGDYLVLRRIVQAYQRCTSNMSYENLHSVLYLTSRLVRALRSEKRCEWWLTNGSGVGLWRGLLVPWEPDVDLAMTARTKEWCMKALQKDGHFNLKEMLLRCRIAKENKSKCSKKTDWTVAQRLSLSEDLKSIHQKTRVDLHVFEQNKQGQWNQQCGVDAQDRQCKVKWNEEELFPLKPYRLKGGLEAMGPSNMTAFMGKLFPHKPTVQLDKDIKAQLTEGRTDLRCIAAVDSLGWVQDHLFLDFWENLKKHPRR